MLLDFDVVTMYADPWSKSECEEETTNDGRAGLKIPLQGPGVGVFAQVQGTGQPVVILDRGRPVVKVVPYRGEAEEILRILLGSVRRYEEPTNPVAVEDWEALR